MGEFELLTRIRERLPAGGPRIRLGSGDDAAVTVPGGATATSVDALVDGVHFRRGIASPEQIGHKALATALSDLAAMGAEPGEAYVVLGVPGDLGEEECLALLDGMTALAKETGTVLAGGDLSRASQLFLAITVVGHAASPGDLVTRDGARRGDALVLTGEIGAATAALRWPEAKGLLARQLEPTPRLAAGRALAANGATAMIDVSDGLGADTRHLAGDGIGLRIDAAAVPLSAAAAELSEAADGNPWGLFSGGEDYELLAALPPERFEAAADAVREAEGTRLTKIGEVLAGSGVEIRLPDGRFLEPGGFDQLA